MFQDRYKSETVESDPYFTVVLRYIHQNPQKAGICRSVDEYKWSSYKEYINKNGIVDHEYALGIIGNNSFVKFMNERIDGHYLEFPDPCKRKTDEELIAEIEETFKIKAAMIQSEPKENRNRILESILKMEGVSTRQLSRVTGISTSIIWALPSK